MKARLPAMCEADEFDVVARGDCTVYRPDGDPLFVLLRSVFDPADIEAAWPALQKLKSRTTNNRSTYGGARTGRQNETSQSTVARDRDGNKVAVSSAIVGYFDRQGGRHPFCRTTAFTADYPLDWANLLPIAARTSERFRQQLPKHFERQMLAMEKVRPEYRITGTPFTTLTVNNNTRAGIHKDKGDFKDGFGCMAVFRKGDYQGAWLGFPQYRVAADMQHGDLILFNPHEYHANTPYIGDETAYERISVVLYMREKMQNCLSPELEVENARKVRGAIA